MASLLESFRNSSMPKRLLRYALSRFDVLDADALDLDNLDLAWGMKTVLEFRDVGLQLKKLHQLLQLPPNFHILRARVALLRVTLPVDIYSSPIHIQITGVDIRLKIDKDRGEGSSLGADAYRAGRRQASADAAAASVVPSAQDLAQSFLEQQPLSETQALEEALEVGDQHLAYSASEDEEYDDEDDDSASSSSQTLGTGQALTLPGFLAGFLQGIVDRIQVAIEGVTFQLDVHVPVDTSAADVVAAAAGTASPESVTFQLALARINVEGVTKESPLAPEQAGPHTDGTRAAPMLPIVPKEGKRHISLEHVRACLISEANVFSTLARSPSVPSSRASQTFKSPRMPSRGPPSRTSSALSALSARLYGMSDVGSGDVGSGDVGSGDVGSGDVGSGDVGSGDDGEEDGLGRFVAAGSSAGSPSMSRYSAMQDSEDAFNIPYELGGSGDDNDSQGSQGSHGGPAVVDDGEIDIAMYESSGSAAASSAAAVASTFSTPRASFYGDNVPARAVLPPGFGLGIEDNTVAPAQNDVSSGSVDEHSRSDDEADSADDLVESHVFSHDEAESMYMSAFSQAQSLRLRAAMPGGWNDDDDDGYEHDASSNRHLPVAARGSSPVGSRTGVEGHPDLSTQLPIRPAETDVETANSLASLPAEECVEREREDLSDNTHTASRQKQEQEPEILRLPPDDAATPRGPARLVKEILTVKYVSIYVPSNHKQIDIPPPTTHTHADSHHLHKRSEDLKKSVAPHLPGAFSAYSPRGASSVLGDATKLDGSLLQQPPTITHDHEAHTPDDHAINVTLAPLEIRFDASIGFLLAIVVSQLVRSVHTGLQMQQQQEQQRQQRKRSSYNTANQRNDDIPTPSAIPEIRFHAEKIALFFLDKLAGVADTAERFFDSPRVSTFNQGGDILLQSVLEDLAVDMTPLSPPSGTGKTAASAAAASLTKTSVRLKRFRFGYADADIVSFDQRRPLYASVRDVIPPGGDDLSLTVTQSSHVTKCEINTLPLQISVDLQRLDETFSWFGGLSCFLSMGSSSMSSVTSQAGSAGGALSRRPTSAPRAEPVPLQKQPQRGVRFDVPSDSDSKAFVSETKVDLRIGGVRLDLVGKDCSVGLDTSAVKLVSRTNVIGVGVTRTYLKGPYLRNSGGEPPITAKADNTRLEFLNVPEDKDLERLLELITPSRVAFDERDDVIMVDTLLRQRRSGPLLRLNVDRLSVDAFNLAQLSCLPALSEEIARLGMVAKYLPEDDRPGLLTLGLIRQLDASVDVGGRLGLFQVSTSGFETAHITIPSLVSAAVGSLSVRRNDTEELIGSSVVISPGSASAAAAVASPTVAAGAGQSPALMLRIIGDDMEPMIKIKMWGINVEYRVPTIMDVLGLSEHATPQDFEASLAASVANLGEQAHSAIASSLGGGASTGARVDKGKEPMSSSTIESRKEASPAARPTTVNVGFRDCVVGLNPLGLASKLNIVLADARLEVVLPQEGEKVDAVAYLSKVNLLLVDDISTVGPAALAAAPRETATVTFAVPAPTPAPRQSKASRLFTPSVAKDMAAQLAERGFVDVCQILAAKISVHVSEPDDEGQKTVDLEVRDDLLVLETCADSTQTLISLANALKPPTPPSKEVKFKTQVMPVKDLLASISIDAFGRAEGNYNIAEDFILEEDEYEDDRYTESFREEDDGGVFDSALLGGGNDSGLYGAGSGESHIFLTDQGNLAAEQSVASLPSIATEDNDLLLDAAADDDALDVEGDDHGISGTVAEKLFSASSVLSDGTELRHGSGLLDDGMLQPPHSQLLPTHGGLESTSASPLASSVLSDLGAEENFFGTASDTAAEEAPHTNRWNSAQNGYDKAKRGTVDDKQSPLRLRVRDVHVIWNLFDGYDWQRTRDVIAKTVKEVEAKAYERRTRHRRRSGHADQFSAFADEEEEETVIGDFLFNSIYIGIPATHDPHELAQAINQEIYGADGATETESVATTTETTTTVRDNTNTHAQGHAHAHTHHGSPQTHPRGRAGRGKPLKLARSRHHKITFELGGVGADLVVYPAGSGEMQSSIDVRVRDLDIFDHVPTSTWKKFATYDRDAGERPINGDMVHAEVLVVKPVPTLAATEFVLKVGVLPLRLHVDQDALDFITRFFAFKDETAAPTNVSESDVPFIQRAEILDIPVQLDFKPKRVDYAGLRSGHTTEFMNFLILDGSRMTLRHTIIYGVSGFERLGKTLNDIWMPDIKRHQLPGVLAGLATVRSLVTVGSGVRDLIEIPIQEYRHNGRLVRSISKGAMAFARSTGTELVKLGAKMATGTQYVLQGAEGMLNKEGEGPGGKGMLAYAEDGVGPGGCGNNDDYEERKHISLYADQPADVVQGLRHAYSSLARDLHMVRDAIIAVPAEVRENASATGAAKVVIQHAPTIIFRPVIGATKAIGQTLMGATNSLDPANLRRAEDKYKSGPGRM